MKRPSCLESVLIILTHSATYMVQSQQNLSEVQSHQICRNCITYASAVRKEIKIRTGYLILYVHRVEMDYVAVRTTGKWQCLSLLLQHGGSQISC